MDEIEAAVATMPVRWRSLRLVHGMKTREVAEALNVDPTTVSGWEHGRTEPSLLNCARYAKLMRVSLDFLVAGSVPFPELGVGWLPVAKTEQVAIFARQEAFDQAKVDGLLAWLAATLEGEQQ